MAALRAAMLGICVLAFCILGVPLQVISRLTGLPAPPWLSRLFCQALLHGLGIRVVVRGKPGRPGRLIVANHVSWIDILVLGSTDAPCFLAKREVASWPLISTLAKLQDTVFVDRKRRQSIPAVNRTMAERMRRRRSVLLFPEGTTHDGTRRGTFLTSHLACLRERFEAGSDVKSCPVQAVAIAYSDPAAAWIGDATLLPHVWAVLRRAPMSCTLIYGAERRVERGYDRKALGKALSAEIDTLLEERTRQGGDPVVQIGALLPQCRTSVRRRTSI